VVLQVTAGNVADNNVDLLEKLTSHLKGFLFAEAGYITSLKVMLQQRGLLLITKMRENRKPLPLTSEEKYYLSHRGMIETVFDCLKNRCNIDHSRHRSGKNFFINLGAGLLAYTFMYRFPSIPAFVPKMEPIANTDTVLI
jgi:hypothetical protein